MLGARRAKRFCWGLRGYFKNSFYLHNLTFGVCFGYTLGMSITSQLRSFWNGILPAVEFSPICSDALMRIEQHIDTSERLNVMYVFDALEGALNLQNIGDMSGGEASLVLDGELAECVETVFRKMFAHGQVCFGEHVPNMTEPMPGTAKSVLQAIPESLRAISLIDREGGHSSVFTLRMDVVSEQADLLQSGQWAWGNPPEIDDVSFDVA